MKYMKYMKIAGCVYMVCLILFASLFTFAHGAYAAESTDATGEAVVEETPALYDQAFELLAGYIYGSSEGLTPDQNLVMTALATMCALFIVALPFLVVFVVIRFIGGR